MQLNELEVMAMLMRASIDAHLSIFDYLNQVFGTSVTPETKISINGGTMSIRNAIAYNFKKGNLEGDTKEKI